MAVAFLFYHRQMSEPEKLMYSAAMDGRCDEIKALVADGSNVNFKSNDRVSNAIS